MHACSCVCVYIYIYIYIWNIVTPLVAQAVYFSLCWKSACVYVCVYAYTYTYIHACICVCIYMLTYLQYKRVWGTPLVAQAVSFSLCWKKACTYAFICMYVCIHRHTFRCMHADVCIYTYTYIHMNALYISLHNTQTWSVAKANPWNTGCIQYTWACIHYTWAFIHYT